mmetsp:Transcript_6637/g.9599  ORF Transcript_6637/g.9599 Transcript_6637/m.9599 type:complete len:88 (-) Transcript_6637:1689-1952(-)
MFWRRNGLHFSRRSVDFCGITLRLPSKFPDKTEVTSFEGQESRELKQIEEARKKLRHDKLALEEKFNELEVQREELARELARLGGKV